MIGRLGNGHVTEFEGVLPPRAARAAHLYPGTSDALIALALAPLQDEIEMALQAGDNGAATELAYGALSSVAGALARHRGDCCPAHLSLVHALAVELEPLPLEPQADGTLAECGLRVRVAYQNWTVDPRDHAALERYLATHWLATEGGV